MFKVLRKATAAQLGQIAGMYDSDRSGHIDVFEFKGMLDFLGLSNLPMAEARRLFEKHDERHVGQLELLEMIKRSKATTVELMNPPPPPRPTKTDKAAAGPTAASEYFAGLTSRAVQLEALAAAEATINEISAAADAADAAGFARAAPGTTRYYTYGGPHIETHMANIDLIDAQYLIALSNGGGIVPPWQLVPEAAKITPRNVWRLQRWDCSFSLPILVLSLPWFDEDHPDNKGESFRRIVPLMELMVRSAKRYGPHTTVGIFWDFASMPQGPNRTPLEQRRFDCALRAAPMWYHHPFTLVLLVDTPVPPPSVFHDEYGHVIRKEKAHGNTRPFDGRGWTFFELHCASLVKDSACLWSLSQSTWSIDDYVSGTFRALQKMLSRSTRPPPTSPPRFAKELRDGIASQDIGFSVPADLETVLKLYTVAFVRALDNYASIFKEGAHMHFRGMGYGDEVASTVADAMQYAASRCVPACKLGFDLKDNEFSEEVTETLRSVLPDTASFYLLI